MNWPWKKAQPKVDGLPNFIVLNETQKFPVIQVSDYKTLGAFNRGTGEIFIRANQPEPGKHIILMHELLHFVADLLIQEGIIKRQPDHAFIENAAPTLIAILVSSGLYRGVTNKELVDFMTKTMMENTDELAAVEEKCACEN